MTDENILRIFETGGELMRLPSKKASAPYFLGYGFSHLLNLKYRMYFNPPEVDKFFCARLNEFIRVGYACPEESRRIGGKGKTYMPKLCKSAGRCMGFQENHRISKVFLYRILSDIFYI